MTSELGIQRLKADGRNRAKRTFVVNAAVDIGIAIYGALGTFDLGNFDLTDPSSRKLLYLSLGKTVVLTVFSYLLRVYGDPSKLPTPLPPEDPGPPAEDVSPTPPITAVEESGFAEEKAPPATEQIRTQRPVPYARLRESADQREAATGPILLTSPMPEPGTRAYALWLEEQQARGGTPPSP